MPSANKKSQLRYHSLRTLDSTVFSRHLCKKNPLTCSGHDDGGGPHWGCCRVCGHGATRFTVLPSLLSTVNVPLPSCVGDASRDGRGTEEGPARLMPPATLPSLPFCPTNFAPGPSSFTPFNHFLLYAPTFLLCALETDKHHQRSRRRRRQDRPVKKRGGTDTHCTT